MFSRLIKTVVTIVRLLPETLVTVLRRKKRNSLAKFDFSKAKSKER